jgi:hypothetical protein
MKRLLLTIALLLLTATLGFGQAFTNGVYVQNGKTFEVDKKEHRFTTSELLHFSNGLVVKTYPNSDFSINSLFQEVLDLDKPAHVAKFGNSSFAATLMTGGAIVTYSGTNENSSCVISTPMTDLELSRGTFYIKVTENGVVAAVLDGSLKAHGEKKKEIVAKVGDAIVCAPIDRGIFEDKFSLDSKRVTVDNVKKLTDEAQEVVKTKDQFLFIIVDGKVLGVNIN